MKNDCEKYELAITNFVLGEKMNVSESELFNHLAACKNCQGDLRNWRATHAMMCAKEYDSRPDVKAKNEAFIKNLVYGEPVKAGKPVDNQSLQGNRILIDAKREIDSAAEKIHNFVKVYTNGDPTKKVAYPVIREGTAFRDYPFHEAMGTLFTNKRLIPTKDQNNRPDAVLLNPGA